MDLVSLRSPIFSLISHKSLPDHLHDLKNKVLSWSKGEPILKVGHPLVSSSLFCYGSERDGMCVFN